ncbi:MAG: heme-binding protein [Chromatiales bacterium]|nr:heme-binding protein [Chromatiales bacterium]
MKNMLKSLAAAGLLAVAAQPVLADDVITVRQMTAELAGDIAREAMLACREKGYQASAVVVDRAANTMAVMRDTLAARHTISIAEEKANAVIMSGVSSGDFVKNRGDIRMEMNHVEGIIMLDGGLPIQGGGYMLGAVGVSGAPGGDIDAACAQAGIDAVADRLAFIE